MSVFALSLIFSNSNIFSSFFLFVFLSTTRLVSFSLRLLLACLNGYTTSLCILNHTHTHITDGEETVAEMATHLQPHTEDSYLRPRTAVRRRQRRRQLEAHPVGDYNLSPGEHGGAWPILSPGHESEEGMKKKTSRLVAGESKDLLAALREEEDDIRRASDNDNYHFCSSSHRKEHKRMAVLNNQPSLEFRQQWRICPKRQCRGQQIESLFPIFSKGQKTVHLVRHGQSTYNEAISGPGSWEEPKIFDARLTKLGIEQAKELGKFLSELPKDAVWITSPLTRAMETCVYGREANVAFVSPSSAEDEKFTQMKTSRRRIIATIATRIITIATVTTLAIGGLHQPPRGRR